MIILPWIRADLNAGEGQLLKVSLPDPKSSWAFCPWAVLSCLTSSPCPRAGVATADSSLSWQPAKGRGKETPSWNPAPYKWRALVTMITSWEPGLPRAAPWAIGKLIIFFQPIFFIPWFTIHIHFLLSGVYVCSFKNVGKALSWQAVIQCK